MAKKQNLNYERNPWKMVLYIVAVVALAACLVFLVYTRRETEEGIPKEGLLQLQSKETEDTLRAQFGRRRWNPNQRPGTQKRPKSP